MYVCDSQKYQFNQPIKQCQDDYCSPTSKLLVTNIAYFILLKVGEVFNPHASFFEMMGALEVYRLLWSLGLLWILRYQRIIKMSKPP